MPKALIILGAAVWPGGLPSPTLTRRTEHAVDLFQKGGYDVIVASGGLGKHPPTEAEVMTGILTAKGVPIGAIMAESRATTTQENIAFSMALLKKVPISDVTLVSDYFHLPRAIMTARRHGLRASGSFPTKGIWKTPLRKHLYALLREAVALPVYWLRRQR